MTAPSSNGQPESSEVTLDGVPLIATAQHGGPYDTDTFLAGVVLGTIHAGLTFLRGAGGVATEPVQIPRALREQVDLVAMNHGLSAWIHEDGDRDPDCPHLWVRFAEPGSAPSDDPNDE